MNIFKNIYNYRELLKTTVKKDIRGRYKNSFLGVIWSFFNPLLQLLVYAIVFPLIMKNTPDNYVIFICVALIPWTYFTTTVSQASYAIIGSGNIIKIFSVTRFEKPIILLHDASAMDNTAKVLPQIIDYIKEQGYRFDTLDHREEYLFPASWR